MFEVKKDSVILSTASNKQYDLPFLWLRDNCQCDECRIKETQEKQFLLHTVPVDISPKSVEIKDEKLLSEIIDFQPEFIIINLGGGIQEVLGNFLKINIDFKSKIICCKTIRDKNKLALSSRNILLNKTNLNKAGKIAKNLIIFKFFLHVFYNRWG